MKMGDVVHVPANVNLRKTIPGQGLLLYQTTVPKKALYIQDLINSRPECCEIEYGGDVWIAKKRDIKLLEIK